ncbi:MAG: exodeoxyribonuclease III [Planctomycetes bacterium]|nr:exodeoxyribonuclease III [Planctomycetota bacterium]
MLIATWNVNSIRARKQHLLDWLATAKPDVMCLQELKVREEEFPFDELGALGYEAAVHAQPTYNGVAVISRLPIEEVIPGFAGEEGQARLLEAVIQGVHVLSVYCPNGQDPKSDKFEYKERFFAALRAHLDGLAKPGAPLALCGDTNIAPEARDVWDPEGCAGSVGFHPREHQWLRHLADWGLHDSLRLVDQRPGLYSWWDYRGFGYGKNRGMRIDQIWVSQGLKGSVKKAWIDVDPRTWERPSDHTPVLCELAE